MCEGNELRVQMRKCMTLVFVLSEVKLLFTIELPNNVNEMPSKIAQQYPGYSLIFHYDNITKRDLDLFLNDDGPEHTPVIILMNYDEFQDLRRPSGYQFVNIVYLTNPFLFEAFSNGRFNLEHTDVVVFVTSDFCPLNNTRPRFDVAYVWNQKGLDQSGCVVLYDISTNDFYYVRFYVGNVTGVLNKIPNKSDVPRLLDYINEFRDFNGHNFNVAFYPYAPFIYCGEESQTAKGYCAVEGIDGEILKLLSGFLNFRFRMKNSATLRPEGEWKAMIKDVYFKRVDWAVGGISQSLERMELADFTEMLHMESYTGLYVSTRGDTFSEWKNILLPFQFFVWIGLLLIIFCLGVLIKTAIYTRRRNNPTHTLDYLRMPYQALVDQAIPSLRYYIGGVKVMLSSWFLVAIIVTTAYKSKLASSMIQPHTTDPTSIQDLFDRDYLFQVNQEDWTVLRESLQGAPDRRYQKVLERSRDDLEFCAAIKHIFGRKVAVIDEETPMQYIVKYKTITTKPIPKSNLHVIDVTTASSLTISTFLGPAFILLVGIGLAFVVFLFELAYFKCSSE